MIYLSQLLGNSIYDSDGERLGTVSDLGIATGEVFPRVTSLAFMGPGKTPFMISWRKYVASFDENEVQLKVPSTDLRFSYLQPSEVLIARDLLDKQIVDTRGMRVVRVNDLKLSDTSSSQLRLLGAEVGLRGLLRSLSPRFESLVCRAAQALGHPIPERIIAWNYMDLLERDLSDVKLSVSHKTLDDMHPADIADIIERLDPRLRGQVFDTLDDEMAAEAVAELDDDGMAAELVGRMEDSAASKMLSEMDPDDAAELVSELDYERAEKLLRLMGVKEQAAIRQLLGYREDTAGRIMTSEFVAVDQHGTVADAVQALAELEEDFESVRYVYLVDAEKRLVGVVTLVNLLVSAPDTPLASIASDDLVTASPEDDQEDVAQDIAKYNLLAMPVVDDDEHLIGIVTVDDALEVLQEEHEEDLALVGGAAPGEEGTADRVLARLVVHEAWFFLWALSIAVLAAVTGEVGGNPLNGILLSLGLPVALRAAVDMVRSVTAFCVEHDPDDEDAPSSMGFLVRGVSSGITFGLLIYLVIYGITNMLDDVSPMFLAGDAWVSGSSMAQTMLMGFAIAGGCVALSYLTAPLYLLFIRKRDAEGEGPTGSTMRLTSMAVTCVIYVVAALMVGAWS
jgi:Mg2+ transporter MgtE